MVWLSSLHKKICPSLVYAIVCVYRSAGTADEPPGRGDISDVDPADVGWTSWAWRWRRRVGRLLRVVLQRLAPQTERPRHHLASCQLVPPRRSHARYCLSHQGLGTLNGARWKRQHADHTSPHSGLRSDPPTVLQALLIYHEIVLS